MSGHNKWSKIKHKKAATDAKKSKEFGRLVRDIKVAVIAAGGNESAAGVQLAIDRAKASNMPKNNIERAVKSAKGAEGESLESVLYETYGPAGVAIIVVALTDNKNRTAAEMKKLLGDHGAELAAPGSAAWAFENDGSAWLAKQTVELSVIDREKLHVLTRAIEKHDDVQYVTTNAS